LGISLKVSSLQVKGGRKMRRSPMAKTRNSLYKTARILGDIQAVAEGRAGKRIARRLVGRATGKLLGKLLR
jgi:hypothetical protein